MNTKLISALAAALIGAGSLFAGGEGWTQDFTAAKATATKEKKDLLMDFTGSDWCGWCIRLNDEVFSKDAFKNVAPKEFVLVELDFPKDAAKVTPEIKAQNEKLQKEYAIEGFPTILLADPAGRPYAKTGYQEGGPEKYVASLATLKVIKTARDEAFAKAAKAEGLEKAKLLVEGLAKVDAAFHGTFYKDEVAAIVAADKDDTLGFGKKAKIADQAKEFEGKVEALRPKIMESLEAKDFAAAGKLVDGLIADGKYQGEIKQRAMTLKIGFFGMNEDHVGALKYVDEIIAVDDKSEIAGSLKRLRPRIEAAIASKVPAKDAPAPAAPDAPAPAPAPEEK